MILYKDNLYFSFDEIKDIAIESKKQQLLNSSSKFLGDINKIRYNKKEIGLELVKLGYKKRRFQVDKERKLYYYKD